MYYMFVFFFGSWGSVLVFFFFQAEDGIRDTSVTGVQTCALPICKNPARGKAEDLAGDGDGLDLGLGRIGQRVAVEREFDRLGAMQACRQPAQLRTEARPSQLGEGPVAPAERPVGDALPHGARQARPNGEHALIERMERAAAFPQFENVGRRKRAHATSPRRSASVRSAR